MTGHVHQGRDGGVGLILKFDHNNRGIAVFVLRVAVAVISLRFALRALHARRLREIPYSSFPARRRSAS